MACKKPALSSNIVICLGLFLVSTSFCHGKGLTKLEALDKSMGNHTLDGVPTESRGLHKGRLLIGKNKIQVIGVGETETIKKLPGVDEDYQADMGWERFSQPEGQDHGFPEQKQDSSAVEQLLKMEPKVECTQDSMKLQVQDAASYPGSLLFVDRGSRLSPLPLSKLPPSCGYSIQSTMRDLVLVAPYDGCFVSLQEDTYVLPLRWWGLPVKMSCPLMRQSSPNRPMVTCHAEGMIVKTEWTMSADKIKVKLSGDWKPLMTASSACRFGVVAHPEGVVISVHFAPCLQETDGMYTLDLAGDEEIKISCPLLPTAGTEKTQDSMKNLQNKVPSKGMHPPTQSHNVVENHTPQTIDQPQYPDLHLYPNYFLPSKPESTHTETQSSPSQMEKNTGKPQQPVAPPVKPVPPKGQAQQSFFQYPYQPQPATKPSQPQAPNNQVQQSFVTQQKPKEPTAAQKPSHAAASQGQVYHPYPFYHYPLYSQPEPGNKPASETETPQSQVDHQYYHFPSYFQSETEKHPQKPTSAAKPQQPEAPQGQGHQQFYHYPYYFYSGQDSAAVKPPKPVQPGAPKGQAERPFPPKEDHIDLPAKKPAIVQKPSQPEDPQKLLYPKQETGKQPPTQPEAPKGQVHQQLFHQPEPDKQPAAEKPAQPQVPQSSVYSSFHHPYFFHQPKNPPVENPTGVSKPAPSQSYENQFAAYQYPPYSKQHFGKHPATEPTQPPHQEDPKGKVHQPEPQNQLNEMLTPSNPQPDVPHFPEYKPSYPYPYHYPYPYNYPFYSQSGPSDQQTAITKPPSSESKLPTPDDQSCKTEGAGTDDTSSVKNPQQPQYPAYATLPPVTSIKDSHQASSLPSAPNSHQASSLSSAPDSHQASSLPSAPVSNQASSLPSTPDSHQASSLPSAPDNQQLYVVGSDPQILPNNPPVYCPQYCPSGLSTCCVQIAFHQHLHHILPAQETPQFYPGLPFLPSMFYTGSDQGLVSAPFPQKSSGASPALSVKDNQQFHQPPDGNLDALKGNNPSKSTNQKPIHSVPHPVHPYQPYLPQHPQSQLPGHNMPPSQSQALSKEQAVQHPLTNSEMVSTEQRPSDGGSEVEHPEVIGDPNRNRLLQYLLQNAQGLTAHGRSFQPQPLVGSLQEPNHQAATNTNPEPHSYVLLQHSPPGRGSYGFNGSPLPSTDLIHDAHHQSSKPQYPQNPQQPEWLRARVSNPSPENGNYMPRSDDGSSYLWHISAPTGPHLVPLSQDPLFSADNLKPQFPDFWKPVLPGSLGQKFPPLVHPEAFKLWSPAADGPQNGSHQPSEEEGGTQK